MISLTEIPFSFNIDRLLKYLKIDTGTERAGAFNDILNKVQNIGKPKALYKVSFIDEKGDDTVTIDGITFKSLALRKNLDSIERVFPYIATCGTEIDGIEIGPGDLEAKYWINVLKENMLQSSMQFLRNHLAEKYRLSSLSSMNPGSGDVSVWPLEQQKYLYSICDNVEELIGVRLTKSAMLAPEMSLSGIFFPSEVDFETCQLCQREKCRSRRAAFDKELWESIN
jgi:hypothetical protein